MQVYNSLPDGSLFYSKRLICKTITFRKLSHESHGSYPPEIAQNQHTHDTAVNRINDIKLSD
jgi:hypothetical protein